MKYLLDANVLISLATEGHVFYKRVERWIESLKEAGDALASCSITELAFVRVMTQLPDRDLTVEDAKRHIIDTKARFRIPIDFIADDHGAGELPAWVRSGKQTTDGHLAELAKANGALLATLDRKIPGAFVIPENI